jgi:hypothetical protein
MAAAIAIARAGCEVTVLEAAAELGEIGAGIQMTPNVSRLLIKWGVSDIIGDDLVQCRYINMRNSDGTIIQRTELVPKTVREFGFPVGCLVLLMTAYSPLTVSAVVGCASTSLTLRLGRRGEAAWGEVGNGCESREDRIRKVTRSRDDGERSRVLLRSPDWK